MTQTAGLAVTYFDRYLSKTQGRLVKQRVQLMALTCTLLASKFSETKMPSLDDLCKVAHDKYSMAQIKDCELDVIRVLQWELHAVTPHAALEQFAIVINLTDEQIKIYLGHAEFFIDMSYFVVRPHPDIPTPSRAPRPAPAPPPTHTYTPLLPGQAHPIRRRAVWTPKVPASCRRRLRPPLRVVAPGQPGGNRASHAAALCPLRCGPGDAPPSALLRPATPFAHRLCVCARRTNSCS